MSNPCYYCELPRDDACDVCIHGKADADELQANARDAARYRWLVANSSDVQGITQFHVWEHSWEPHSQTGEPTEWKCRVRGPALDRAIDKAMSTTPSEKDGGKE